MNELLLHPRTATILQRLAASPPHALLLTGPEGTGKQFTAIQWLHTILKVHSTQIHLIEPDEKAAISVTQIRNLYKSTRTRQEEAQFYILSAVGSMSAGAQNAFLKLLEEPGNNIHFILLAASPQEVLPTILSRVQHVPLLPLGSAVLQKYFEQHDIPAADAAQIAFITGGRIGLAAQLVHDKELLAEYRNLAGDAKVWIGGSAFDRLMVASRLGGDRVQVLTFLQLAGVMASTMLSRATVRSEQQRWVRQIALIHQGLERLAANGNIKAQLTHLALAA